MKDFKLDSKPKINSGFKTPEHYFEDFSEKLMQQLPEEETKVISIFSKRKNWMYACAAILVLALSIPFVFQNQTQEIDATTLENYLAINSGITDVELIDLLHEEDINKIEINENIDDKTIEDILINNSNFEQYINY
mgnify:FL=1